MKPASAGFFVYGWGFLVCGGIRTQPIDLSDGMKHVCNRFIATIQLKQLQNMKPGNHTMITTKFSTMSDPHAQNMQPIVKLWAVVLHKGVAEASAEIQACLEGVPPAVAAYRHGNALAWLTEVRNLGPGSFVWLCDLWEMDPARVRESVLVNAANLAGEGRAFAELNCDELTEVVSPPPKKAPPLAPAKEPRVCAQCGEAFNAFISRPDRYCSRRCRDELKRERSRTARVAALQTQNHTSIFPCLY